MLMILLMGLLQKDSLGMELRQQLGYLPVLKGEFSKRTKWENVRYK